MCRDWLNDEEKAFNPAKRKMKQIEVVKSMSGIGSLTYWVEIKLITAAHRLFLLLWFGTKDLGDDILFFFHGKCKSPCIIAADCSLRKKTKHEKIEFDIEYC